MKKSIVLMSAFFISLMLITPSKVEATTTNLWASVETVRVLQSTGSLDVWFNETSGVFSNKRFRVEDSHPKYNQIMAILLTVITTGDTLRVNFDDGTIATVRGLSFFPN
jgi:hypothetical protein